MRLRVSTSDHPAHPLLSIISRFGPAHVVATELRSYNHPMDALKAKDFLVDEIKEQARLDEVSLDAPEIQMLYFTEQDGLSEEMEKLVTDFDSRYNIPKYERKIARLMRRAYERLKRDNSPAKQTWDTAIRQLRKGDHYILVMWGGSSRWPLFILIALISCAMTLLVFLQWLARNLQPPNPHVLQIAFLAVVIFGLFFRRRIGYGIGFLAEKVLTPRVKSRGEKRSG
jgi:hypothetical protein